MSIETVRQFLLASAPEIEIIEMNESTATVMEAAAAHDVEPGQIAKTLCVRAETQVLLVVTRGDARLDNSKFKARFGAKPAMLALDQVEAVTGHPVGGVSPFGLKPKLPVYCDLSLRAFQEVIPAAGSRNSSVRLSPDRLAELVQAEWVDVSKL